MTTLLDAPTPRTSAARGRVTFPHVVTSEWIKLRTLRSSWLTVLGAVVVLIGIACLIATNTGPGAAAEDRAPSGVLQGYYLAQLLVGVLGVLFTSSEYATGMIRATLAAVPKRIPVLLAKAVVFSGVIFTTMAVASVVAFLAAQPLLPAGQGESLADGNVLRVVLGTALYLTLIGLLGSALGWIVRSTPGGISALVGLLLVAPVIFSALPGHWAADIKKVLPSEAGAAFVSTLPLEAGLSAGAGLAVLLGWLVVALGSATVLLRRRDG
jgi:ABC-2 type transport system permease protein